MQAAESDQERQRERASLLAALVFVVIALPAGFLFAVVTPPFRVPDEVGHFWRAYAIGSGVTKPGASGSHVPRGLKKFVEIFWRDAATQPEEFNRYTFLIGWRAPLERESPVLVSYPSSYLPAVYFPQVAAAAAGNTFGLRPIITFYLGRLFCVGAFVAIVALAIRTTPVAPWAFAAAGLFPMTLFLAASWSADVVINACSFLFIALLLRATAAPGRIGWREVTAIAVAGFFVGMGKLPFAVSALLLLAIPAGRFDGWRTRLAMVAAAAGGLACGLALAIAALTQAGTSPEGVDAARQLSLIASSPLHFPAVFLRDLATNGIDYVQQMVGRLGMLDLFLPGWLIAVELVVFFLAALSSVATPRAATRASGIAAFALGAIGISAALYLGWTPVGAATVEGIQGRYFIALLPLVAAATASAVLLRARWLPLLFASTWVVSIGAALRLVLQRYYP